MSTEPECQYQIDGLLVFCTVYQQFAGYSKPGNASAGMGYVFETVGCIRDSSL